MPKSTPTVKPEGNVESATVGETKAVEDAVIAPDKIESFNPLEIHSLPPTKVKSKVKSEVFAEDIDEPKEKMNDGHDAPTGEETKKGLEPAKKTKTKGKVRVEVQQKILAYLGQELQVDREDVSKQEVAEGCGFKKAGAHSFFYSWQDLEKTKKWVGKSSSGKGLVRLTDAGRDNIPKGVILATPLDNAGKQQFFKEALLNACDEAKAEKVEIIFDIFKDGEPHPLNEFIKATGYANMKSKGLGYPFSHMEKKMKIVEKCGDKMYQFTDKCFPDGRPA